MITSIIKRNRATSATANSRQAGASLIEAVLFLVIVVVVILGVFALFTGAFSTSKIQNEMNYVQTLSGNVESLYATNHNYGTADITASLVSTKDAPTPMIVGTGLVDSWGGAVTVAGVTNDFTITYNAVPQKECIQLSQASLNPIAVSINGTAQTLPLTVAAVTTACSSVTANVIVWTLS